MDFIRLLSTSKGFNIIVVFTDYLSKEVLLAAYNLTILLEEFTYLFIAMYYSLHRLSRAIVLDRGL